MQEGCNFRPEKTGKNRQILLQSYTLRLILHPILHPKSLVKTRVLVSWCRKCRSFFEKKFRGREASVRKLQNIGLLWLKVRMFPSKKSDVFIFRTMLFFHFPKKMWWTPMSNILSHVLLLFVETCINLFVLIEELSLCLKKRTELHGESSPFVLHESHVVRMVLDIAGCSIWLLRSVIQQRRDGKMFGIFSLDIDVE